MVRRCGSRPPSTPVESAERNAREKYIEDGIRAFGATEVVRTVAVTGIGDEAVAAVRENGPRTSSFAVGPTW
ncbi:hypothetical protein [Fodinicola acaciae]|uniref:hypothetical protein n=1 Tax=Fodinicola acaciae TaxID=2681555 RepID=UPI0013CF607E|nr:hypothetical protein [Fodinicola acaciae]